MALVRKEIVSSGLTRLVHPPDELRMIFVFEPILPLISGFF